MFGGGHEGLAGQEAGRLKSVQGAAAKIKIPFSISLFHPRLE